MKTLNKAIFIALGLALPVSVMASPDDDVTIRMMDASEHATEAVTREIELPEVADEHAKEHAAKGLDTANKNRMREHGDDAEHGDVDHDRKHEHDMDSEDREHEMEREQEHEREMEMEREDRKDIEHEGMDREEVEREDVEHDNTDSRPEFEAPEQGGGMSGHDGR